MGEAKAQLLYNDDRIAGNNNKGKRKRAATWRPF